MLLWPTWLRRYLTQPVGSEYRRGRRSGRLELLTLLVVTLPHLVAVVRVALRVSPHQADSRE